MGLRDALFVLDIYPASELPIPGISGQTILDEVRAVEGERIKLTSTPNKATAHLAVGNDHDVVTSRQRDGRSAPVFR